MDKCLICKGTGFVPLGEGIKGLKECDCCNGTGAAPERIAETSKLVGGIISIDYSGEKPVLKIGDMKIKEHGM